MKIVLDSNVHDLVVDDQVALSAMQRRVAEGRLTLVSTHVQRDELSRAPEPRRAALLAICGMVEKVSTSGAVWDVSNWDESSWGSDSVNASIVAHMAGNTKHAEDALIAATAADEADVLVTNDARLASKIQRAKISVKVWSWSEFVAWLG
ncbi:hypothetical protein [Bradyrhizobium uaiense]|uniref:PIN domain-containing protein n=1 Tax=Bradyrhizobium uaiense TaxID=2594946 RepID=A0A6P1BH83_9BRAD|nr:hypothetical protein [Bradyrhizobium uaiense]NEU97504.1 hypothetical protein [Bradyrhizobium uaiense]